MRETPLLLIAVGVVYGLIAWGYWQEKRPGMCLAFIAYALANLGFAWDLARG